MSHSPQETGQNTGETERESREQAASPGLRGAAAVAYCEAGAGPDARSFCLSVCLSLTGFQGVFHHEITVTVAPDCANCQSGRRLTCR